MMNVTLQSTAAILPNVGLGGLSLRTPIRHLQPLLDGLGIWRRGSYSLASLFEARYILADVSVEIAVDVRNGKVARLTAVSGYPGVLFGNIRVGMSVADAMHLDSRLYYDEAEELILCRGVRGVAMSVPDIDPDPDAVAQMHVESISVYALEIETAVGQRGDW